MLDMHKAQVVDWLNALRDEDPNMVRFGETRAEIKKWLPRDASLIVWPEGEADIVAGHLGEPSVKTEDFAAWLVENKDFRIVPSGFPAWVARTMGDSNRKGPMTSKVFENKMDREHYDLMAVMRDLSRSEHILDATYMAVQDWLPAGQVVVIYDEGMAAQVEEIFGTPDASENEYAAWVVEEDQYRKDENIPVAYRIITARSESHDHFNWKKAKEDVIRFREHPEGRLVKIEPLGALKWVERGFDVASECTWLLVDCVDAPRPSLVISAVRSAQKANRKSALKGDEFPELVANMWDAAMDAYGWDSNILKAALKVSRQNLVTAASAVHFWATR